MIFSRIRKGTTNQNKANMSHGGINIPYFLDYRAHLFIGQIIYKYTNIQAIDIYVENVDIFTIDSSLRAAAWFSSWMVGLMAFNLKLASHELFRI